MIIFINIHLHSVTILTFRSFSLSLCEGGNYRGVFALGLVQGEWKMYVKGLLDREERNLYIINVTASDGLFVSQATVEITVMDANDNSPVCDQVCYRVANANATIQPVESPSVLTCVSMCVCVCVGCVHCVCSRGPPSEQRCAEGWSHRRRYGTQCLDSVFLTWSWFPGLQPGFRYW